MSLFGDTAAWKEAVSDTVIGTIINFPLNMLAVWTIFHLKLTVFESSVLLWIIFTSVAIIRKYFSRLYWKKKLTSDQQPV